jgi:regulator of sigma E protease
MDLLTTIVAFIALLAILVLVHELGHFIVAKRAGITVQEFGFGFPPRITSIVWRGTRYSLNWIPLGGFVKMLGVDGDAEADKMRQQGLSETAVERAMEGAFNRKPIWVRLAVLLAGVVMNLLLAVAVFALALSLPVPEERGPLLVTEVQADSPAEAADLRVDDLIVSADGRTFVASRDLIGYVRSRAGERVALSIERGGETIAVSVVPRDLTPEQVAAGLGAVGFSWRATAMGELPPVAANPWDAIVKGATETGLIAWQIPGALVDAVGGLLGLNPDAPPPVGPIGIAEETGRLLQEPLVRQLAWIGLLSINLAVLNVLPFPPLDGGRIAVVLVEAIRRRRMRPEREALIYLTGVAVLITLVILISIRDVQNL